jgi:hypothetical protein
MSWAWRPQAGPQKALVECPLKEIFFGGTRGGGKKRMACSASGRSKRSARALIVCDFKEMGRLPMASGFSAIQNNSDVSQGLSPRLAPQSTTRAVGILMPLWSRSEQIKVQAIPGLIGQYGDVP